MAIHNGIATRQWSKISVSLDLATLDATFTPQAALTNEK
jgi:hypothetical protein